MDRIEGPLICWSTTGDSRCCTSLPVVPVAPAALCTTDSGSPGLRGGPGDCSRRAAVGGSPTIDRTGAAGSTGPACVSADSASPEAAASAALDDAGSGGATAEATAEEEEADDSGAAQTQTTSCVICKRPAKCMCAAYVCAQDDGRLVVSSSKTWQTRLQSRRCRGTGIPSVRRVELGICPSMGRTQRTRWSIPSHRQRMFSCLAPAYAASVWTSSKETT